MDEERARILKLLEEGKVTAQEAEKLLLALKTSPRPDMGRDELRARMRRFGLREMRHMPEMMHETIAEAWSDGLSAAVRKQKFEFESKGRVMLRNVSGDTTVEGWDKPTVSFSRDEGGLWKANEREGMIVAKVLSGDIGVRVPRNTGLIATSVSGDISVEGTNGRFEVKTVSGDIVLRQVTGTLEIVTTSGDIKTRDAQGKCHINTVSGDVDLGFTNALGGVVETKSGDVTVWVPSNADVLLELEVTREGEIANEVTATFEKIEERPLYLKLGFGKREPRLWVRSRDGDIVVKSYEPQQAAETAAPAEKK